MKKIPTLFERVFENHHIKEVLPNVTPGMEFVLEGKGDATVKIDGSCCAIIDGKFYLRYDAKKVSQFLKMPLSARKKQTLLLDIFLAGFLMMRQILLISGSVKH